MKVYNPIIVSHFLAFICLILPRSSLQLSLQDELTLTHGQKLRLDKFRDLVSSSLPHDYMKQDLYLMRWLRVNDFNIAVAERALMNHLRWREENKVDTILDEDWSDFDTEYRITLEGCDREGRPILSIVIGEWDMRKVVLAGKMERMKRYNIKLLEEGSVLVRELIKEGRNVTQFVELYDMGGFNFISHGCPQCLAIYADQMQTYEKHYPLMVNRAVTVNTPAYFHTVFNLLKPLLSKHTRDMLSFYGRDKRQWMGGLRKELGAENLSERYGGLNQEGIDIEDIRKDPSIYPCHNFSEGRNNLKREVVKQNKP